MAQANLYPILMSGQVLNPKDSLRVFDDFIWHDVDPTMAAGIKLRFLFRADKCFSVANLETKAQMLPGLEYCSYFCSTAAPTILALPDAV